MGFYLSGYFDESINQMNVYEMVREEEQEFGPRLSKFGKIVFKMNANCIHLWRKKLDVVLVLLIRIIVLQKELLLKDLDNNLIFNLLK